MDPRDARDASSKTGGLEQKITREIEQLLGKEKILTSQDFRNLQVKYNNSPKVLNAIMKQSEKRVQKMHDEAEKVVDTVYQRYAKGAINATEVLENIQAMKKKNGWSDDMYHYFMFVLRQIIRGDPNYRDNEEFRTLGSFGSSTRVNRALGYRSKVEQDTGLNVEDSEKDVVTKILKMRQEQAQLHQDVLLQSYQYNDCDIVAITGKYDPDRHNASVFIHPIIFALFVPVFRYLEERDLRASIGNIVAARAARREVRNECDLKLYMDIVNDPNDQICDSVSPFRDLLNRFAIQIELWRNVLRLRQGSYYSEKGSNALLHLLTSNKCRSNIFDNPDFNSTVDEVTLFRNLWSVMSHRPTIAVVSDIFKFNNGEISGYVNYGQAGQFGADQYLFRRSMKRSVTTIASLAINLPFGVKVDNDTKPINLARATAEPIWLGTPGQNKMAAPQRQSITHTNGILAFQLNRRIFPFESRISDRMMRINYQERPVNQFDMDRLNHYPVDVPPTISIGVDNSDIYHLRSVVCLNHTIIPDNNGGGTDIVTGCNAIVVAHNNWKPNSKVPAILQPPEYLLYNPYYASIPVPSHDGKGYITNKPVTAIEGYADEDVNGTVQPSFHSRASRTGCLFFYGVHPNAQYREYSVAA